MKSFSKLLRPPHLIWSKLTVWRNPAVKLERLRKSRRPLDGLQALCSFLSKNYPEVFAEAARLFAWPVTRVASMLRSHQGFVNCRCMLCFKVVKMSIESLQLIDARRYIKELQTSLCTSFFDMPTRSPVRRQILDSLVAPAQNLTCPKYKSTEGPRNLLNQAGPSCQTAHG